MKKLGIIGLSIGLIATTAIAIAVPVAVVTTNQASEFTAKRKVIEKVEATMDFQDDWIGFMKEINGGVEIDIQVLIDAKSTNWINWINPINKASEIDKTAITKINSVTPVVDEEAEKASLEFKITWKEGLEIPENLKNGYNLFFSESWTDWKDNGLSAFSLFQYIVQKGGNAGVYESADEVENELNNPKHQAAIIDLAKPIFDHGKITRAYSILTETEQEGPFPNTKVFLVDIFYFTDDPTEIIFARNGFSFFVEMKPSNPETK